MVLVFLMISGSKMLFPLAAIDLGQSDMKIVGVTMTH